jgi:hypothetical protein
MDMNKASELKALQAAAAETLKSLTKLLGC